MSKQKSPKRNNLVLAFKRECSFYFVSVLTFSCTFIMFFKGRESHVWCLLCGWKVKVSPINEPYVGECLLKRTLVLDHRFCEVEWPVPFLATLPPQCFHRVSIAAGWAVSEYPTIGSRLVPNRGLRHSRQAL